MGFRRWCEGAADWLMGSGLFQTMSHRATPKELGKLGLVMSEVGITVHAFLMSSSFGLNVHCCQLSLTSQRKGHFINQVTSTLRSKAQGYINGQRTSLSPLKSIAHGQIDLDRI